MRTILQFLFLLILLIPFKSQSFAQTVTSPNTFFIASQDYSVSSYGSPWVDGPFTVSTSTTFVLRFASKYNAQASVFSSDQLNNFENMSSFSGYGTMNNQIGTQYVTLPVGTYYVGARNTTSAANEWSIELDYNLSFPASDASTFYDIYIQGTKAFQNGGKLWNEFTVQDGFRYFLDGCNIGFGTYIIPENQLNAFQNGQSFTYYSDYASTSGEGPGLYEIRLPPGSYYLVAAATSTSSITYTMERWKVQTNTGIEDTSKRIPLLFSLGQNYPNPFNPTTTISYQLPKAGHVTLKVFDVLGRQAETLADTWQAAGIHSVIFNASSLPSGAYFYALQAGTYYDIKKLLLLK
jgi:Secretion system C-terminal sorting domain